MKSTFITIGIITSILLIVGWFTYQALNPAEDASNSEAARALVGDSEDSSVGYTDLDGNPIDLQQYAGKIRVVNSWATWCPFCVEELKDFERLASASGEDTVVIAINRAETKDKIKAYLQKLGNFEHVIFVQDKGDNFYDSINGFAMPETMYYDDSGQVSFQKRGFMRLDEMKSHLKTVRNQTHK